jgi:hypothetical protein
LIGLGSLAARLRREWPHHVANGLSGQTTFDSIHHPLREEEKAVDLAAMLLGFRHLTARRQAIGGTGTCTPLDCGLDRLLLSIAPLRFRDGGRAAASFHCFVDAAMTKAKKLALL